MYGQRPGMPGGYGMQQQQQQRPAAPRPLQPQGQTQGPPGARPGVQQQAGAYRPGQQPNPGVNRSAAQQPGQPQQQHKPQQQGQQQVQQQQQRSTSQGSVAAKSVEDFVKSLDAELASMRRAPGDHPRQQDPTRAPAPQLVRPAEQTGLGLHVWEATDGYMVVKSIVPNGACGRSGLIHEGDSILSLDGHDMRGKKLSEFGKLALGAPGSAVRIRTRSRNGALSTVTITRLGNALSTSASHTSNQSTPSGTAEPHAPPSSGAHHHAPPAGAQHDHSHKATPSAQHADAPASAPVVPAGTVLKSASGRKYPCRATMQWDYIATRDDELTAAAGESILVAGEYKNPGWVWGARFLAGGQPSAYRLVPANYMTYEDTAPEMPEAKRVPLQQQQQQKIGISSAEKAAVPAAPRSNASMSPPPQLESHKREPAPPAPALKAPVPVAPSPEAVKTSVAPPTQVIKAPEPPAADETKAPSPQKPTPTGQENLPVAPQEAEEDQGALGRELYGDADDPYLDGMFEDESGCISVNC